MPTPGTGSVNCSKMIQAVSWKRLRRSIWIKVMQEVQPEIMPAAAQGQGSAFERMKRGFEKSPEKSPSTAAKPFYASAPARPQVKEHVPSENFVASETGELQEGQKVEHQKFGFGMIVKLEGAAHNPIATILFDLNGEKKIMLNYAG